MKALKLLFFSGILAVSSCTPDPCVDVTCYNDGVCDDGTCICADWYEGADCSTEEKAKYIGNYTGTLSFFDGSGDQISSSQYTEPVTNKSGINELQGGDTPFVLTNSGSGSFNIPLTQVNDPTLGSTFWQGSGSFSGNLLSYNGTFDVQGVTYSFSFSGNK
jgi:hypothetical protein